MYGIGVGSYLNEWLTAAYRAVVLKDLNTMLRTEDYTQGTMRCRDRTDKLCLGEILWGTLEYSGSEPDSLYARTNFTASVLLPTQFFRVRRDRTLRGT